MWLVRWVKRAAWVDTAFVFLRDSGGGLKADHLDREGLNLEVDAGKVSAAFADAALGATAEFSEIDMAVLAEFKADADQDAVNVHAGLALEFEEHVDGARVIGAAAEHPTAAAEDGAGEGLDEAGRLLS